LLRKSDQSHLHRKNTRIGTALTHMTDSNNSPCDPPPSLQAASSLFGPGTTFFSLSTLALFVDSDLWRNLTFPFASSTTSRHRSVAAGVQLPSPVSDTLGYLSHIAQFVRIGEHRPESAWASPNPYRDAVPAFRPAFCLIRTPSPRPHNI
jgi:hypothetical protein